MYARHAVTRNYSEKSIGAILDLISTAHDTGFMEQFYSTTLNALEESKNDRLWFKTNLKLANLWLQLQEYQRIPKVRDTQPH
jgi:COP9 signalosome complex subunit 2